MLSRSSFFFFSSRRRHTRFDCDWSSDVCSSDLEGAGRPIPDRGAEARRAGSDRMRLAFAIITLFATGRLAAQHAARSPRPYRPAADVLDYALSLDLPDSGNRIQGRAGLTVRRTARVDTLVLDLLSLRVDSVLVGQRVVRFRRDRR